MKYIKSIIFAISCFMIFMICSIFANAEYLNYSYYRVNSSDVWVKINLTGSSVTTLYITNTSTYAPNPDTTFMYYDNFSTNRSWTSVVCGGVGANAVTYTNSYLNLVGCSNNCFTYRSDFAKITNYTIDAMVRSTTTDSTEVGLALFNNSASGCSAYFTGEPLSDFRLVRILAGSYTGLNTQAITKSTAWVQTNFSRTPTNVSNDYNYTVHLTSTDTNLMYGFPGIFNYNLGEVDVDNFTVRKWIPTVPTVSSVFSTLLVVNISNNLAYNVADYQVLIHSDSMPIGDLNISDTLPATNNIDPVLYTSSWQLYPTLSVQEGENFYPGINYTNPSKVPINNSNCTFTSNNISAVFRYTSGSNVTLNQASPLIQFTATEKKHKLDQ